MKIIFDNDLFSVCLEETYNVAGLTDSLTYINVKETGNYENFNFDALRHYVNVSFNVFDYITKEFLEKERKAFIEEFRPESEKMYANAMNTLDRDNKLYALLHIEKQRGMFSTYRAALKVAMTNPK